VKKVNELQNGQQLMGNLVDVVQGPMSVLSHHDNKEMIYWQQKERKWLHKWCNTNKVFRAGRDPDLYRVANNCFLDKLIEHLKKQPEEDQEVVKSYHSFLKEDLQDIGYQNWPPDNWPLNDNDGNAYLDPVFMNQVDEDEDGQISKRDLMIVLDQAIEYAKKKGLPQVEEWKDLFYANYNHLILNPEGPSKLRRWFPTQLSPSTAGPVCEGICASRNVVAVDHSRLNVTDSDGDGMIRRDTKKRIEAKTLIISDSDLAKLPYLLQAMEVSVAVRALLE
jgi:hypothetical protein